jgi:putative transcriptional regulator
VTLEESIMDQKIFAELLESANEALEHAKGKRELRTTDLPPPPKPVDGDGIKRLRTRLKMSQAVFARYLNVSTKLVQAWEADRRTPDGPALLLVRLVERNPALVLSWWTPAKPGRARAKHAPRSVNRARRTRQLV